MQLEGKVIAISGPHVTDAMLATLQKHYEGLKVESGERTILDMQELSEKEAEKVALDVAVYSNNPQLALENLCSYLDNYDPKNESQEALLEYANRLVGLEDPSMTAGIWAYGSAGVGKSHVAVALAKEFMGRGMQANFRFAHDLNYGDFRSAGPNQAWVIDDLNSGYSVNSKVFIDLVLNAHNIGGRLFVTSNLPYNEYMDEKFPTSYGNQADRTRYMDRTQGMFKVLEITGGSQRKEQAWYL